MNPTCAQVKSKASRPQDGNLSRWSGAEYMSEWVRKLFHTPYSCPLMKNKNHSLAIKPSMIIIWWYVAFQDLQTNYLTYSQTKWHPSWVYKRMNMWRKYNKFHRGKTKNASKWQLCLLSSLRLRKISLLLAVAGTVDYLLLLSNSYHWGSSPFLALFSLR